MGFPLRSIFFEIYSRPSQESAKVFALIMMHIYGKKFQI